MSLRNPNAMLAAAKATAIVLATLALTACATLRQPLGVASWNDTCYDGLHVDVDYLGGTDAYDCGLLHIDARDGALMQIAGCAREAVASGRPYRFGYQTIGSDSMVCGVAVRARDGQLWFLDYDSDVSGQFGSQGNHAALWVRRCKDVRFARNAVRPAIFFELDGCQAANDMFDTLQKRRDAH
jgi:hypothetical protein